MICYLDSSALVKRYILEPGSEDVEQLVSAAEVVGTAWISLVEVVAALAKAARTGVLTSEEADSAIDSFRSDWLQLARLQITEFLLSESASLARKHGLRGYDAVQLAAATLWQRSLELPVYLVTFDHQLWLAAASEGLLARPEELVRSG